MFSVYISEELYAHETQYVPKKTLFGSIGSNKTPLLPVPISPPSLIEQKRLISPLVVHFQKDDELLRKCVDAQVYRKRPNVGYLLLRPHLSCQSSKPR